MKILLFGKNGQVGQELQRSLASMGTVVALGSDDRSPLCGNLTALDGLAQTVRSVVPDVIVNAAAYTAVDKAESERDSARLVNAQAPGILAQEAQKCGAWLVHYSSDYVFDGNGVKPWQETDIPNPVNFYGQTKLEGEHAIQASGCRHLIFRSSWIYAVHGHNFIRTMLRLAQERDQLKVVDDQIGAPTGADLVANVTAQALQVVVQQPEVGGLYNLSAAGETSWYDYTRFILDYARQSGGAVRVAPEAVLPVPSTEFPTPAQRPHNSRLDNTKLQQAFGLTLPDWQDGVVWTLAQLLKD